MEESWLFLSPKQSDGQSSSSRGGTSLPLLFVQAGILLGLSSCRFCDERLIRTHRPNFLFTVRLLGQIAGVRLWGW